MLHTLRRTLLILPVLLAACGFTPEYAPGGTAATLRGAVSLPEPEDEASYLLVRELEQRLGRVGSPRYDLEFALETVSEGQAVTASGNITRYSLVGSADFTLTDQANGAELAKGSVRNFTGYSATGSTVETRAAERDARARLVVILADQIVARLYATADVGS